MVAVLLALGARQALAVDLAVKDARERFWWWLLAPVKAAAPVQPVPPAYLGIMLADVREVVEEQADLVKAGVPGAGAFVLAVAPAGPAAQAGLQAGDVITEMGDVQVEGAADVSEVLSSTRAGTEVPVSYVRLGKQTRTTVVVTDVPDDGSAEAPAPDELGGGEKEDASTSSGGGGERPVVGLTVQTLSEPEARAAGLDPRTQGARVTEVVPGSPADRAGLRPGDTIVEIDHAPVGSAREAAEAFRTGGRRPRALRVLGTGGNRAVTLTPR